MQRSNVWPRYGCCRGAGRGSNQLRPRCDPWQRLTLSPVSQAVEPQSMQSALSCLSGPRCIRLLRQLNVTALSACGVLCCALQCELRRQRRSCSSGWCRHCVWGLWVRSPQAPIPPQADRSRSARGASTTRRSWRLITGEGERRFPSRLFGGVAPGVESSIGTQNGPPLQRLMSYGAPRV